MTVQNHAKSIAELIWRVACPALWQHAIRRGGIVSVKRIFKLDYTEKKQAH